MQFQVQLSQSLTKLLQNPQQFNLLSKTLLLDLAKKHNLSTRLLPSELISNLVEQIHSVSVFQNRKSALKFGFYFNLLRHVVLINFHQLKDNKIFGVLCQVYAQKLQLFYHEVKDQQKSIVLLKKISQLLIINEVMLKFVLRAKTFFPEYIKALKLIIQKIIYSINRNLKHKIKNQFDVEQGIKIQNILNLAYGKDTQKKQLIQYLFGVFNFTLKQAASFFNANANKKQVIALNTVQQIIANLQQFVQKFPNQLSHYLIIPPQFKKYELKQGQQQQGKLNNDEPIFLQQTIKVRELTPRFYNEQENVINKLLRKKRNKLQKKMQLQLRQNTHQKLQERRILENVKKQKIQRQVKKDLFVIQRQTQQAKKAHKQMKKVKAIKKQGKMGRKGKR